MPQLINWELIREPVNWGMIILMLLLSGFVLHLLIGDNQPTIISGM